MIIKLLKKIRNQRKLIELLWFDTSRRRESWIRSICKKCTNEIHDEDYLRDSTYNYGCIRCKKKDVHPDTGHYCWDCFGYIYGLDAYEFIENNYVIDVIKREER
tara:strand:- start:59 stop:370 length:312 start_codon:yes stop_codon:yes gene_type:complete